MEGWILTVCDFSVSEWKQFLVLHRVARHFVYLYTKWNDPRCVVLEPSFKGSSSHNPSTVRFRFRVYILSGDIEVSLVCLLPRVKKFPLLSFSLTFFRVQFLQVVYSLLSSKTRFIRVYPEV